MERNASEDSERNGSERSERFIQSEAPSAAQWASKSNPNPRVIHHSTAQRTAAHHASTLESSEADAAGGEALCSYATRRDATRAVVLSLQCDARRTRLTRGPALS